MEALSISPVANSLNEDHDEDSPGSHAFLERYEHDLGRRAKVSLYITQPSQAGNILTHDMYTNLCAVFIAVRENTASIADETSRCSVLSETGAANFSCCINRPSRFVGYGY
jgi:hypothetical protein